MLLSEVSHHCDSNTVALYGVCCNYLALQSVDLAQVFQSDLSYATVFALKCSYTPGTGTPVLNIKPIPSCMSGVCGYSHTLCISQIITIFMECPGKNGLCKETLLFL